MIDEILEFIEYLKSKNSFYTLSENLDEIKNYIGRIPRSAKRRFLKKWDREILDEDLKWCDFSNIEIDWEITIDNIYIYGGFKTHGFSSALISPPGPDYETIDCEHDYFTDEEEQFLKEETKWFCQSAHGMGNGSLSIFHRTKDKYPFDILFLDRGRFFKTNFTLEIHYQAMIDSMAICGWQYFYLDFEEIKNSCSDFKVGIGGWLTLYPYGDNMSESPLGRDVTKETKRIDALVHHMEVCVYVLPKIFPEKDFSYHKQRLEEFKTYLQK